MTFTTVLPWMIGLGGSIAMFYAIVFLVQWVRRSVFV